MAHENRINYLDTARGFAVFFMILQHAMIVFGINSGNDSLAGETIQLLGTAPAAPVFMIVMGLFFARSQSGVQESVMRGIKLVLMGYLLNLLRFSLPVIANNLYNFSFLLNQEAVTLFYTVDILQMAGMSLIVMALLKRYLPYPVIWAVMILIIVTASPLLWGLYDSIPGSALLWGDDENTAFPFFPWIIYPLIGMTFNQYVFNIRNFRQALTGLFVPGIVLTAIGVSLWLTLSNPVFIVGDYHRSGPAVHLVITGFVMIWLSACILISEKTQGRSVLGSLLTFWSRHVTSLYFVQWICIGWGIFILGENQLSHFSAILAGVFVVILSDGVIRGYCTLKKILNQRSGVICPG